MGGHMDFVDEENMSLLADLYELTMCASCYGRLSPKLSEIVGELKKQLRANEQI